MRVVSWVWRVVRAFCVVVRSVRRRVRVSEGDSGGMGSLVLERVGVLERSDGVGDEGCCSWGEVVVVVVVRAEVRLASLVSVRVSTCKKG